MFFRLTPCILHDYWLSKTLPTWLEPLRLPFLLSTDVEHTHSSCWRRRGHWPALPRPRRPAPAAVLTLRVAPQRLPLKGACTTVQERGFSVDSFVVPLPDCKITQQKDQQVRAYGRRTGSGRWCLFLCNLWLLLRFGKRSCCSVVGSGWLFWGRDPFLSWNGFGKGVTSHAPCFLWMYVLYILNVLNSLISQWCECGCEAGTYLNERMCGTLGRGTFLCLV